MLGLLTSSSLPLNNSTPEDTQGEWVSLFDGKTLNGWHRFNRKGVAPIWTAKDGVLTFAPYISKVLKQIYPNIGISQQGMFFVNFLINCIFQRLAENASRLLRYKKDGILSAREFQTAVLFLEN